MQLRRSLSCSDTTAAQHSPPLPQRWMMSQHHQHRRQLSEYLVRAQDIPEQPQYRLKPLANSAGTSGYSSSSGSSSGSSGTESGELDLSDSDIEMLVRRRRRRRRHQREEHLQQRQRLRHTVNDSLIDSAIETMEALLFHHLLLLTVCWQLLMGLMINWLQPDAFALHRSTDLDVVMVCWLGQLVQVLAMCLANFDAWRRMHRSCIPLGSLIRIYTANCFTFAGIYFACFLTSSSSFRIDLREHRHPLSVLVIFIYFSVATQGTAGFGDVVPLHVVSQTLASIQMLASVLYSVAIFVVGTAHICSARERISKRSMSVFSSMSDVQLDAPGENIFDIAQRAPGFSYWGEPIKRMPLLVTLLVVTFNLVIVYAADADINVPSSTQIFLAGVVLTTQTLQSLIVFGVSVSLVRKIESKEVTSGFLAQSYLSTAVLFSGMYFAMFLIEGPDSWNLVDATVQRRLTLPGMVLHFLYFSITAQTSCGYGDYYPRTTSTRILVSLHLLAAMTYTAVVLGLGMSHLVGQMPSARDLRPVLRHLQRPSGEVGRRRGDVAENKDRSNTPLKSKSTPEYIIH